MFQKILIPLDGSERAESIMPHAIELAERFGASLVLLQVIDPGSVMPMAFDGGISAMAYTEELKAIENRAQVYLSDWKARLGEKSIKSETILTSGPIVHTIVDAAEQAGVDLIAMSSHGRTGVSRVFYGSIAAGVLHSARTPLLLVRADLFDEA